MDELKAGLLAVIGAGLLTSILLELLKDGAVKQTVRLVIGLVITLLVLAPLADLDLNAFGQYMTQIQMEREMMETGIPVENEKILSQIIQEKTEAYILDKAGELGAEVMVSVVVEAGDTYPYPYEAVITGTLTKAQQESLAAYLEQSLAIPEERQVFQTETD